MRTLAQIVYRHRQSSSVAGARRGEGGGDAGGAPGPCCRLSSWSSLVSPVNAITSPNATPARDGVLSANVASWSRPRSAAGSYVSHSSWASSVCSGASSEASHEMRERGIHTHTFGANRQHASTSARNPTGIKSRVDFLLDPPPRVEQSGGKRMSASAGVRAQDRSVAPSIAVRHESLF